MRILVAISLGKAIARIEVHISIAQKGGILTIKFLEIWAENVLVENEVYNLCQEGIESGGELPARAWIADGTGIEECHEAALIHAAKQVLYSFPNAQLFLLSAHSALQPDNRISRHRQLWGSYRYSGLELESFRRSGECIHEVGGSLRVFGWAAIDLCSLRVVAELMEREIAAHVVVLRLAEVAGLDKLVEVGWDIPQHGPSAGIISTICAVGGQVLRLYGSHDDRGTGSIAFNIG